ncbi:MAG: hypothetical protein QM831_09810 [Kofleriaceae bacterium]
MMKALALALSIPLVGCVVGPSGTIQTGDDTGGDDTGMTGSDMTGSDTSGHILSDTTWTGTKMIDSTVTIDPGVTVTVMPGAAITFTASGTLNVNGTLTVAGVKGNTVMLVPDSGLANFNVITVTGTLNMTYAEMTGGWLELNGATTKIIDSTFSHATHDLVVMDGGSLDVSYSMVGVEPGNTDTTHCDLHFGGTAPVIKANHSTFSTSSYGVMFYAGMDADFTYDNWIQNTLNIDPMTGQVTGDFSNSFFGTATAPTTVGLTATNPAAARLAACDGTNDGTCAGPR